MFIHTALHSLHSQSGVATTCYFVLSSYEIAEEVAIAHVEAELKRLSDHAYDSGDEEEELVEELTKATQSTSSLNDSGYSDSGSTMGDLDGANALLFLANSPLTSPTGTPRKHRRPEPSRLCITHTS